MLFLQLGPKAVRDFHRGPVVVVRIRDGHKPMFSTGRGPKVVLSARRGPQVVLSTDYRPQAILLYSVWTDHQRIREVEG